MPHPQRSPNTDALHKQAEMMESMQSQIHKLQSQMVEGIQDQMDAMQSSLTELGERLSEAIMKLEMILPAQADGQSSTKKGHIKPQTYVPSAGGQLEPMALEDMVEPSMPSHTLTESRYDYNFKDSCWELALLIGMPEVDIGGSITTSCTLILDIIFQVVLSLVIQINLVKDIPMYNVELVRIWRESAGHVIQDVDFVYKTSNVARICQGTFIDQLWWQNALLSETQAYTKGVLGIPSGHWLCSLTILIWLLLMWSDLQASLRFLQAIFALPRHESSLNFEDGGFVLSSISHKRFASVILIASIRLGVIGLVTVSGVLWLAYTRSLRQFLSNMAALKCIPNLDRLMFQCFISSPVQHVFRSLKPLPIGKVRFYRGVGLEPLALAIVCIVVIAVVYWSKLLPNKQEAEDVRTALCGGNQDFVCSVNDLMTILRTSTTSKYGTPASTRHQHLQRYQTYVLRQLIQNRTLHRNQVLAENVWLMGLKTFAQTTVAGFVSAATHHCDDYEQPTHAGDKQFWWYWLAMSFHVGLQHARSCIDAIAYCSHHTSFIVRFVCPVTCGCASPISFQNWQLGCPARAACDHHSKIARPCVDMNASELGQNWSQKWNSWVAIPLTTQYYPTFVAQGTNAYIPLACSNFTNVTLNNSAPAINANHMYCEYLTSQSGAIVRPISAFCPISCQCHNRSKTATADMLCPLSCNNMTPPLP